MSITLREAQEVLRHPMGGTRVRSGTVPFQSPAMGELDVDLIDHLHWARQLRGLAENTLRVRIDVLHRFATWLPVPLRQATPEHLLTFERMAIAGRAAETRRAYCAHLHSFYRWMVGNGRIATDPSTVLTSPLIPRRLPRPISEEDLALALAAARPKLRAMMTLAGFAGLRACEVAGLEWSDLRRDADGRAFIHVRHGKGNKQRTVEVGRVVIQALQAYGIRRRGPMFLGVDGNQITANAVSRAVNRHLLRCEIEATCHQLRHRYATTAYQLSRDLRMVQEQLGHQSADTTAGYARPSAEAAARMVAAMDSLVLPIPRPAPPAAPLTEQGAPS
jgi:integrase/recombinase XerC